LFGTKLSIVARTGPPNPPYALLIRADQSVEVNALVARPGYIGVGIADAFDARTGVRRAGKRTSFVASRAFVEAEAGGWRAHDHNLGRGASLHLLKPHCVDREVRVPKQRGGVERGEPERFDSPGVGHYCPIHFPANDGFVASALGNELIEEGGAGHSDFAQGGT
jgi:hypothetical protein